MADAITLWAPLSGGERRQAQSSPRLARYRTSPTSINWLPGSEAETMQDYLYRLTVGKRGVTNKALQRAADFLPVVTEGVRAQNLPPELACLPLVESAFEPNAVSPAGAAGLWQLMPDTARRYGLEVSAERDERFDVPRATMAATSYLAYLYQYFGDWPLALAAYNCGEGTMQRAVEFTGQHTLESILHWMAEDSNRPRVLAEETQRFVPSFAAAVIAMSESDKFGFSPRPLVPLQYPKSSYIGRIPVPFAEHQPGQPGQPPALAGVDRMPHASLSLAIAPKIAPVAPRPSMASPPQAVPPVASLPKPPERDARAVAPAAPIPAPLPEQPAAVTDTRQRILLPQKRSTIPADSYTPSRHSEVPNQNPAASPRLILPLEAPSKTMQAPTRTVHRYTGTSIQGEATRRYEEKTILRPDLSAPAPARGSTEEKPGQFPLMKTRFANRETEPVPQPPASLPPPRPPASIVQPAPALFPPAGPVYTSPFPSRDQSTTRTPLNFKGTLRKPSTDTALPPPSKRVR
jgi:membrane-bound lytic murein transglycosylase D